MFYNAGVLKTMKDPKILKSTGLSNNETISEALASTLATQGWKAPTKSRNHDANLPYPKWFKCKFCRCKFTPPFKKCECPCSRHKSRDCPNKESKEKDNVNNQCLAETLRVNNILIASDVVSTYFNEDSKQVHNGNEGSKVIIDSGATSIITGR